VFIVSHKDQYRLFLYCHIVFSLQFHNECIVYIYHVNTVTLQLRITVYFPLCVLPVEYFSIGHYGNIARNCWCLCQKVCSEVHKAAKYAISTIQF